MTTLTLRQADGALAYVETLLENNGLPSADVRSKPECFYVGYAGDTPVGVGGLEVHGSDGLVRSLVVDRSRRGNGFGTAICAALEREARSDGVEVLYLLTTTAAEFFAARGYRETDRASVPERIRETTEFADLCPASAVCLSKPLETR